MALLKQPKPLTPEEEAKLRATDKKWQSSKPVPMFLLDEALNIVIDKMLELEEAVEKRFDQLEEQQLRYQGVHDAAKQYVAGDIATYRGGLWHCNTTTKTLPGKNNDWRLMAKTPVARGGAK